MYVSPIELDDQAHWLSEWSTILRGDTQTIAVTYTVLFYMKGCHLSSDDWPTYFVWSFVTLSEYRTASICAISRKIPWVFLYPVQFLPLILTIGWVLFTVPRTPLFWEYLIWRAIRVYWTGFGIPGHRCKTHLRRQRNYRISSIIET